MVYHENPWGPHPAAVEAVREVLGKGPSGGGINRYDDFLQNELKRTVLRYNRLDDVLAPLREVVEMVFNAVGSIKGPQGVEIELGALIQDAVHELPQEQLKVFLLATMAFWRLLGFASTFPSASEDRYPKYSRNARKQATASRIRDALTSPAPR